MGRIYGKGKDCCNFKHGFTKNPSGKKIYSSWANMKSRCLNPKCLKFSRYGGRGIKICEEWLNAIGFYQWAINNGWKDGLQIDRIDNNGNYEPSNCRWISASDNARRKGTTKISYEEAQSIRVRLSMGERVVDVARKVGVNRSTINAIKLRLTHVPPLEGRANKLKRRV